MAQFNIYLVIMQKNVLITNHTKLRREFEINYRTLLFAFATLRFTIVENVIQINEMHTMIK